MRRPSCLKAGRCLLWLLGIGVCVLLLHLVVGWKQSQINQQPPAFYEWFFSNQTFRTGFEGDLVKIVHQSWVDRRLPRLFARWSQSFPKCFPDFQYRLWTDEDNRKLIATHYAWFLPRYDSYGVGVQKADVSRLFYLYHHGGLYCDLDCECLRNFEHLLVNASLAFGAMLGSLISSRSDPAFVPEGQIENSFMYSRPRHPFIWDLILRLNATTQGMPIMTTGPYLIMSGINAARKLGLDQKIRIDNRPYLTIFPPSYFNPFTWIGLRNQECALFGQFSNDQQLRRCRDSFPGSYVVQYHTQVWEKGKGIIKNLA